jgi:hypothetical protein
MVHFRIGQNHRRDGGAAQSLAASGEGRERSELVGHVRRGIEEQPGFPIIRDGCGGLAAKSIGSSGSTAIGTLAIPLRQPTPGCGTKDANLHNSRKNDCGRRRNGFLKRAGSILRQ